MRQFYDQDHGVRIYDSMEEVIEHGLAGIRNSKYWDPWKGNWITRSYDAILRTHSTLEFANEQEFRSLVKHPWQKGLEIYEEFREILSNSHIPEPKSRLRRTRWSEIDGEMNVDRALCGDPVMFREAHRTFSSNPTSITLVCNNDSGMAYSEVIWRGAAALALTDLLEQSGYSVELWIWNGDTGWDGAFNPGDKRASNLFLGCRFKASGDPLNVNDIICALTDWFMRIAWWGAYWDCHSRTHWKYVGGVLPWNDYYKNWMDVENTRIVPFPMVGGKQSAIEAALKVLQKIEQQQTN